MSSITFLVSLLGRHGDRGGDLHRQRDQKRTEHVLCQEQGEYFLVFLFLQDRRKVLRLFFLVLVADVFNGMIFFLFFFK